MNNKSGGVTLPRGGVTLGRLMHHVFCTAEFKERAENTHAQATAVVALAPLTTVQPIAKQ